MTSDPSLDVAATAIATADALLVTAGAGMGVDSGLPDFRGNEGFWNAYPAYASRGLSFAELANPAWFARDPHFAWGFYGHRLALYRATKPHRGFQILRRWGSTMRDGAFVFTSNVDGQFQRAAFEGERIVECHGAIDFMQCMSGCSAGIFRADDYLPNVDPTTFRAADPLPSCPRCGQLARPNILMFGDGGWDGSRSDEQHLRFQRWIEPLLNSRSKIVVVECGAGTAIPTVRRLGEQIARSDRATLVRLNVREPTVPSGHVGLAMGALAALEALEALEAIDARVSLTAR
jgi:NAD-dependent SIR2 family protein deacetylase